MKLHIHDQATAMVDQACDVLTTAFPDLWYLMQLYSKRKLYPLSEVNYEEFFFLYRLLNFFLEV